MPDASWRFECGDGPDGLLALGEVDHVMCDAPFSARVDANSAAERVRDPGDFPFAPMTTDLLLRSARAIAATTRRWALVFTDYEEGVFLWRAALEDAGMKFWQTGHWRKTNPKPQMTGRGPGQPNEAIVICHSAHVEQRWNGGGKAAEWTWPSPRDKVHPTQKPPRLMADLVNDFTDPGELVADIFAGSAMTGVAAIGASRRFAGFEILPELHAIGLQQLASPLFDMTPTQTPMFDMPEKGAAQRSRMALDQQVLETLRSTGSEGANLSLLLEAFPDATEREIQRSIERLMNRDLVSRVGRTKSTRYIVRGNTQQAVAAVSAATGEP